MIAKKVRTTYMSIDRKMVTYVHCQQAIHIKVFPKSCVFKENLMT